MIIVLLLGSAAWLLVLAAQRRNVAVRIAAGATATALAMTSGIALVNDYYGYYRSWSPLSADLSGASPDFGIGPVTPAVSSTVASGSVRSVDLPGAASHIDRRGYVYLPPQYDQPAFAHTRFPVVELFHGSPGRASDWVLNLRVAQVADALISRHLMGPMVLVMPEINGAGHYLDCVNSPIAQDDTYLSRDVPADIRKQFRVSADGAQWGLAGYSSGGYCAADLALRHRRQVGAAAIQDGYFRPQDGPAGVVLGADPAALRANDALAAARDLTLRDRPLPSFWVSAGTGDRGDISSAKAFVAALDRHEQVTFAVEAGAGHNFYSWSDSLPFALAWMWQQLSSPDLRVLFPVLGPPTSVRISPYIRPFSRARHLVRTRPGLRVRPVPTVTVTVTAPPPHVSTEPAPAPTGSGTGPTGSGTGSTSSRPSPTPSSSVAAPAAA